MIIKKLDLLFLWLAGAWVLLRLINLPTAWYESGPHKGLVAGRMFGAACCSAIDNYNFTRRVRWV
jgi:hypothetical protein